MENMSNFSIMCLYENLQFINVNLASELSFAIILVQS